MLNRENQTAAALDRAHELLDAGEPAKALAYLKTCGPTGPAIHNAQGVCHLRLGQHEVAMRAFRELVFPHGALVMPRDTPPVFVANYALAHLMMENPVTALSVLHQCAGRDHPSVVRVRDAARQWKRSFPWWRRALTIVGAYPPGSPPLDFAPGDLWPGPNDRPV